MAEVHGYHYDPETRDLDFAILRLDRPVIFSSTISPICLPNGMIINVYMVFYQAQVRISKYKRNMHDHVDHVHNSSGHSILL